MKPASSKPTTPKSKASPKKAAKAKAKATPKKDKVEDNSSDVSSLSASCVEVADSESDSDLDMAERLRQRKAALHMEWQDYEGHQHSYGAEADSLETFTKQGLESKGWRFDGGQWTKPVAPRAPGAMKVMKKPSNRGYVIIHPSQDRNQSGEQEADQEGHREQQPCRQKPIRDEDQGQQEADEKGRIQSRSPTRHESHESEEDRLETEEAGEAEEAGQEVGPCFYWLGPGWLSGLLVFEIVHANDSSRSFLIHRSVG